MSAFATAMAALVADRHLGVDAVYRAGGAGDPIAVRVVRTSPDRVSGAFETAIVQATDVLTVAADDLPALASGDTFTILDQMLKVQHVERSASGVALTAYCRRS